MGFENPILGGEDLIREAMRSPNYVAGSIGWRIAQDGSAEFNNVTVRGILRTAAPPARRIEIGTTQINRIEFYSGDAAEVGPAYFQSTFGSNRVFLDGVSGATAGDGRAMMQLNSAPAPGGLANFTLLFTGNNTALDRDGDVRVFLWTNGIARYYGAGGAERFLVDNFGAIVTGSLDVTGNVEANGYGKHSYAYAGYSGAHGGDWSQMSHWNMRGSAGRYGYMHGGDGHYVLLSGNTIELRHENSTRFGIDANAIWTTRPFILNDNRVYTRAWGDLNHYFQWHGNVDGLYIAEYGGVQIDTRDGYAFRVYHDNVFEHRRFDQLGAWNTMVLRGKADGGGSPCGIAFWESGRGCAPFFKSWFEAIEARNNPNTAFCIFRGVLENYSTARGKGNIKALAQKVNRAQRKEKVKRLRPVHFDRDATYGGCANCLGTGKARDNLRLAGDPEEEVPDDDRPCPDCAGLGRQWRTKDQKKNEEQGWFGLIAEEVETEFPEAVFYREDDDGIVRPSGLDAVALIAVAFEEIKDLEERLAAMEEK